MTNEITGTLYSNVFLEKCRNQRLGSFTDGGRQRGDGRTDAQSLRYQKKVKCDTVILTEQLGDGDICGQHRVKGYDRNGRVVKGILKAGAAINCRQQNHTRTCILLRSNKVQQ